jgi:ABC-2 type transport system ATP-binding protein
VIHIEGLGFGYRRQALYEDFALEITQPGVHGLFGRNGSGKSTLLLLLAGLLFPHKGRISVGGRSPAARHPHFLQDVYIVPEEFHLPNLKPAELAASHAGFYPRFSTDAFLRYLQEFEVPLARRFGDMSLGQKKKAALAFGMAALTPVLLLDEPTNGLDIVSRDQFKRLMSTPEQRSRIVLISTHQAHDLERIMTHILFIDAAKVALAASMEELSRALRMGVTDSPVEAAAMPGLIYQEPIGEQVAYVARGAGTGVHLELLYKALSLRKQGVLDAVQAAREASRV